MIGNIVLFDSLSYDVLLSLHFYAFVFTVAKLDSELCVFAFLGRITVTDI